MATNTDHKKYLNQCFELAKQGETLAFPNPIVGCVIVHQDEIIAEGFHRKAGEAHAEVNAINNALQRYSATALQPLLKDSTIYVSLEPCAHQGKTPPCADLIIKHKFKQLVFSSYDPNPQVSMQGIERIRAAGIEVIEPRDLDPKLVKQSDYLNRVFFKSIKKPDSIWLTVKIATTEDGRMITRPDEPRWITSEESRRDVHRMRSCHDVLITSIPTIRADDPSYNVRHSAEELGLADIQNPDIVIFSSNNDLSEEEKSQLKLWQISNRKIHELSASIEEVLQQIKELGYKRVMVEAGPKLSQAFIDSDLVDEVIKYQANKAQDLKLCSLKEPRIAFSCHLN